MSMRIPMRLNTLLFNVLKHEECIFNICVVSDYVKFF